MTRRPRLGVLGGTFDPIHLGHLAAAQAAQAVLELDAVRFIPSGRPPHRADSPQASEYHRLAMIRLAIAEAAAADAHWEISDLELRRTGPSYTVDTLGALHAEGFAPAQIVFILGADAFADVATWHRYPDVLDAAHFAVVARPGTRLESLEDRLPGLASRMTRPAEALAATSPAIVLVEAETPDVSSTEIRRRAARGEPLDGLVSPDVAGYIDRHALYRGAAAAGGGVRTRADASGHAREEHSG